MRPVYVQPSAKRKTLIELSLTKKLFAFKTFKNNSWKIENVKTNSSYKLDLEFKTKMKAVDSLEFVQLLQTINFLSFSFSKKTISRESKTPIFKRYQIFTYNEETPTCVLPLKSYQNQETNNKTFPE